MLRALASAEACPPRRRLERDARPARRGARSCAGRRRGGRARRSTTAPRGGVVDRCVERGLAVLAHAPLGGRRARPRLARSEALRTVAAAHDASPAEVALACASAAPASSRSPGARRRRRPARPRVQHGLDLDARELEALVGVRRAPPGGPTPEDADLDAGVVLVMGIPAPQERRGAARRGGLRPPEPRRVRLAPRPRRGARRRAAHGRDAWSSDTRTSAVQPGAASSRRPGGTASACAACGSTRRSLPRRSTLVERLLDRFGAPRARTSCAPPHARSRAPRPDLADASAPRARAERRRGLCPGGARSSSGRPRGRDAAGVLVAARGRSARTAGRPPSRTPHRGAAPRLRLAARRTRGRAGGGRRLERLVTGPVDAAVCPHGGGPPVCCCRPPLPGLPSPSPARTASTRRGRRSSARALRTGRSPRRSAPAVVLLPRPG